MFENRKWLCQHLLGSLKQMQENSLCNQEKYKSSLRILFYIFFFQN
jgi:hypothetical protein